MPDEGLVTEDLGSSFAESFLQKQAEARSVRDTPVEETQPLVAAEDPPARARDESGRFTSPQPDEPEPDDDPPAEAAASEWAEFEDLLEKYNGDPREALKAFRHQQELFGRQAWELGELRKQVQENNERLRSWEETPEPVDPGYFDRVFEQNPGQAIAEAIQAGHLPDSPVYERLMDQWVEEDPKAARIDTKIRSALQQQMYEQRLAELQAPIQQTRIQSEFTEAYRQVAAKVPDIDSLPMQEAAKQPFFQAAIQNARSAEERASVLEAMTVFARGLAVPSVQRAAVQATEAAEAEARRQRDMAVVASGSQVQTEPPLSREDRARRAIRAAAEDFIFGPIERDAA